MAQHAGWITGEIVPNCAPAALSAKATIVQKEAPLSILPSTTKETKSSLLTIKISLSISLYNSEPEKCESNRLPH
jgi:hypothetical protein